jgi:hypothetical protein
MGGREYPLHTEPWGGGGGNKLSCELASSSTEVGFLVFYADMFNLRSFNMSPGLGLACLFSLILPLCIAT